MGMIVIAHACIHLPHLWESKNNHDKSIPSTIHQGSESLEQVFSTVFISAICHMPSDCREKSAIFFLSSWRAMFNEPSIYEILIMGFNKSPNFHNWTNGCTKCVWLVSLSSRLIRHETCYWGLYLVDEKFEIASERKKNTIRGNT